MKLYLLFTDVFTLICSVECFMSYLLICSNIGNWICMVCLIQQLKYTILQVDCPFPPSDKIGIYSVQTGKEEIVPMKEMKMAWVPYVPLQDRYCCVIYVEQYLLPFVFIAYILAFSCYIETYYFVHLDIALPTSVTRILLGGGVSVSDTYRIRIRLGYVSSRILKKTDTYLLG